MTAVLKADRDQAIAYKTANSWHCSFTALLQAEVRVLCNQSVTACASGVTCVHPNWLARLTLHPLLPGRAYNHTGHASVLPGHARAVITT